MILLRSADRRQLAPPLRIGPGHGDRTRSPPTKREPVERATWREGQSQRIGGLRRLRKRGEANYSSSGCLSPNASPRPKRSRCGRAQRSLRRNRVDHPALLRSVCKPEARDQPHEEGSCDDAFDHACGSPAELVALILQRLILRDRFLSAPRWLSKSSRSASGTSLGSPSLGRVCWVLDASSPDMLEGYPGPDVRGPRLVMVCAYARLHGLRGRSGCRAQPPQICAKVAKGSKNG